MKSFSLLPFIFCIVLYVASKMLNRSVGAASTINNGTDDNSTRYTSARQPNLDHPRLDCLFSWAVTGPALVPCRLEYNRYLQEVVQLLESDSDFRKKLEKAEPEDIRVSIQLFYFKSFSLYFADSIAIFVASL